MDSNLGKRIVPSSKTPLPPTTSKVASVLFFFTTFNLWTRPVCGPTDQRLLATQLRRRNKYTLAPQSSLLLLLGALICCLLEHAAWEIAASRTDCRRTATMRQSSSSPLLPPPPPPPATKKASLPTTACALHVPILPVTPPRPSTAAAPPRCWRARFGSSSSTRQQRGGKRVVRTSIRRLERGLCVRPSSCRTCMHAYAQPLRGRRQLREPCAGRFRQQEYTFRVEDSVVTSFWLSPARPSSSPSPPPPHPPAHSFLASIVLAGYALHWEGGMGSTCSESDVEKKKMALARKKKKRRF